MGFDYRTYTGPGKQILGGHKQNHVHISSQEKGTVSPQETEPDLPVSVQESLAEMWVNSSPPQSRGTDYRNSSRRNEEAEPKQKQRTVADVSDGDSQVRCCKEQ